jgi:3-isopropylmalate/(R)-2-methylmalate dehydratase small subunit
MESFQRHQGVAVPLMLANVDTDQIVPSKELIRVHKEGYAPSLFANWRYVGDREPNPDFLLNQEIWSKSTILLARENFGCGSSREDAPKALRAFGFRAVIAPSFGGIFFNNCFRNGLLPIEMPIKNVEAIAAQCGLGPVTLDLEKETVIVPSGEVFSFTSPKVLRGMLIAGVDEIDLTLTHANEIEAFRDYDQTRRPWVYLEPPSC